MRFAHVGLTVSDLQRSREFYMHAFGFEPVMDVERTEPWIGNVVGYKGAHLAFAQMRLPSGMHLELIQYKSPAGIKRQTSETNMDGNVHLCLEVDDIVKALERAVAAGAWAMSRRKPTLIETGPNAGSKAVYLRDPDGITIELWQRAT